MSLIRSVTGTRTGNFHVVDLQMDADTPPLQLGSKRFPISQLDTQALIITDNSVKVKGDAAGNFYNILHTNSELSVQIDDDVDAKLKEGTPVIVGSSFFKKASPAPFAYVDSAGKLNSVVLANAIFSESIMGWAAEGKPDTYAQGLVPTGSSAHSGLFLRKDGNWGQPSIWTGAVSEHFTSLQDTPAEYTNMLGRYLRVSYAEGGSVVFDDINTDKVPESTNLYYTQSRVHTEIDNKAADRSIVNLAVQDTIIANDFIADSDLRRKDKIRRLDDAECLKDVLKLKPSAYVFKGKSKTRLGFIAQEVETVIPEVVVNTTTGDSLALRYMDLIPHLVGSIQKLNGEVEMLKQILIKKNSQ